MPAVIGIIVVAAGIAAGAILLRRALARQPSPFVRWAIVLGLGVKLAGSMARYFVIGDLYGSRGDFNRYFENGVRIAAQLRSGVIPDEATAVSTPFMDFVTGVIYVVIPANIIIGFLVFAVLSFVGAYLFLRAFQIALPDGDHRRFAAGVFFLPTMVFWPSSIGKEAWLVFTLGVAAYGAARILRRENFGYVPLLLGTAGAFQVRPHMGALFALCFAGAFMLRFRDPEVKKGAVGWVLGLVLVGLGAGYAASNFGDELPRDESVDGSATDQVFAETDRRTSQGGSGFASRPVRSPGDFVHASITVPFRPFPFEAHNRQAQVTSLEGVLLLGLVAISLPRLVSLPRALLRRPYVAMCAAYCTGFIIAFSNVGNFGILTRQRAQLLPFLLVLLCLPRRERPEDDDADERAGPAPVLVLVPPDQEPSKTS